MKIMISAEGPELKARVGRRFGTSPYLIIVDTQTMAFEAVSNPVADNQKGGAGVAAVVPEWFDVRLQVLHVGDAGIVSTSPFDVCECDSSNLRRRRQ